MRSVVHLSLERGPRGEELLTLWDNRNSRTVPADVDVDSKGNVTIRSREPVR